MAAGTILLLGLGIAKVIPILIITGVGLGIVWVSLFAANKNATKKSEHNALIIYLNSHEFIKRLIGLLSIFFLIYALSTINYPVTASELFGISLVLGVLWIAAFRAARKKIPAPKNYSDSTDHGSAKWSKQEDISDEAKDNINSTREGLYLGGDYQRKKSGHLITIAGSGQGKGTCQILPTLLVDPTGSYVVTDPKGENAFITAKFQKSAGQNVYIIDPWDEQTKLGAEHGIKSSGFNPFAFIKQDLHELRDNCEQIATFLVPDNPHVKEPYWNDRARNIIKVFLMHIITALPEEEHNFWTLYKMVRLTGSDWDNLMVDLKQNKAEDGLISISANELIGMTSTPTTMAGILSGAQNATTIFESPQLRRSLESNDFDPYSLTQGNNTVYVVIPERFLDTHSLWLRMVIGLSLKACNSKPKNRVNFLLDEFAVMGKMKDIQRGFAFARGQNIVLWAFVQNLSQLKDTYGEDGMNTFFNNSAVICAFGIKDNFTTEYISKYLGETTKEKESRSEGYSGEHFSRSTSYSTYQRRLMTPDEVENCKGIICAIEGKRIILPRQPYFIDPLDNLSESDYNAHQKKLINRGIIPPMAGKTFRERASEPPRKFF